MIGWMSLALRLRRAVAHLLPAPLSGFSDAARDAVDRPGRPTVGLIAALVVTASIGWGLRWLTAEGHASGDTFWYTRQALEYVGNSEAQATSEAAGYLVRLGHTRDPKPWVDLANSIDHRYPAIFESRPMYPLVAALLIPVAGLDAMVVSAALGALIFAVALGLVTHAVTGSARASVLAVALAYALPSGQWLAFLYADGWMFAFWTISLGCATAFLRQAGTGWLLALGIALVGLFASKSANGLVLVVAILAVAAIALVGRHPEQGRLWKLATLGAGLAAGQLVLFAVLGAPGINETLQDYFTKHFSVPDVENPVRLLARRLLTLTPSLLRSVLAPLPLAVTAIGAIPLLTMRMPWAALWLAAGIATGLTVLVHPVLSEIPRLLAPVWITVALGLSIGFARISRPRSAA